MSRWNRVRSGKRRAMSSVKNSGALGSAPYIAAEPRTTIVRTVSVFSHAASSCSEPITLMSCSCAGALPGSGTSSTSQWTTVSTSVCGSSLESSGLRMSARMNSVRSRSAAGGRTSSPAMYSNSGIAFEPARQLGPPEARDAGDQDTPAHRALALRADRLDPSACESCRSTLFGAGDLRAVFLRCAFATASSRPPSASPLGAR